MHKDILLCIPITDFVETEVVLGLQIGSKTLFDINEQKKPSAETRYFFIIIIINCEINQKLKT